MIARMAIISPRHQDADAAAQALPFDNDGTIMCDHSPTHVERLHAHKQTNKRLGLFFYIRMD